jgi:hypothetical protein
MLVAITVADATSNQLIGFLHMGCMRCIHFSTVSFFVQSPTQPAAGLYFAGLRWCVELYSFSTCMNFRFVTDSKNPAFLQASKNLGRIISFLALGWARHIAKQNPGVPSDLGGHDATRNMRSTHAVLESCAAWRLSHVDLRIAGQLWSSGSHRTEPPRTVAACHGTASGQPGAAELAVDTCTPDITSEHQGDLTCVLKQFRAADEVQHPDTETLSQVEVVPHMPGVPQDENGDGISASGGRQSAPVLLFVPAYGNESELEGEWVGLHDVAHGGVWRKEAEGDSERCAWSQVSPMSFHNEHVRFITLPFLSGKSCGRCLLGQSAECGVF